MSMRFISLAIVALLVLVDPNFAASKCSTAKIEIEGGALSMPLEVIDPDIVERFSVWSGPNAEIVEQTFAQAESPLAFVAWGKGEAQRPLGALPQYKVRFYCGPRQGEDVLRLAYVVSYIPNTENRLGYMYFPGKGDEHFASNLSTMIHGHGTEGHWFYSSNTWETLVRPLLERRLAAQ